MSCVDSVFLFDEQDPREWLKAIRPNVHVNSSEYTEECIESGVVSEIGAELVLVPRGESILSTSDFISIIQERYSK